MKKKKKATAAIAAVMNYITTEEEAICIQSMSTPALTPSPSPDTAAPMKLWGTSGRQAQMQMRNLMQMRTFR